MVPGVCTLCWRSTRTRTGFASLMVGDPEAIHFDGLSAMLPRAQLLRNGRQVRERNRRSQQLNAEQLTGSAIRAN